MTLRRLGAGLLGLAGLACADFFAPPLQSVLLRIVPVFSREAATAAGDADRLRIVVERGSAGTFQQVKDTTVTIDPDSGTANANISVVLLASPQLFRILLQGVRSSDGAVLYSGVDTVAVQASTGDPPALQIPVQPQPSGAARLEIAPRDTAVEAGRGFTFRTTAKNAAGSVITVGVRFELLNPADSVTLKVDRLLGVVTTTAGRTAVVRVRARTYDDAVADTARVSVGAVPAVVRITPGFLNLAAGATATLTDSIFDAGGRPIALEATWASRNTNVATVSSTGTVTGVAAGTAIILGTAVGAGGLVGDSLLVTVPPAGNVVARTVSRGRAYRSARVGDTVTVDVAIDMRFTPSEKLGSYNARLTWSTATLAFLDVQSGTFASPFVNPDSAGSGVLKFASADASGAAGEVVVARVRFRAVATGSTVPAPGITEMSAAQTFTNLINRVTVTNGHVQVR